MMHLLLTSYKFIMNRIVTKIHQSYHDITSLLKYDWNTHFIETKHSPRNSHKRNDASLQTCATLIIVCHVNETISKQLVCWSFVLSLCFSFLSLSLSFEALVCCIVTIAYLTSRSIIVALLVKLFLLYR